MARVRRYFSMCNHFLTINLDPAQGRDEHAFDGMPGNHACPGQLFPMNRCFRPCWILRRRWCAPSRVRIIPKDAADTIKALAKADSFDAPALAVADSAGTPASPW